MSVLELAFADGQMAALVHYKCAGFPEPTHPVVKGEAEASKLPKAPTSPADIKSLFDANEQAKTQATPPAKVAAAVCTTCRKPKHYGPCRKPAVTKPTGAPHKRANFNTEMYGDDNQNHAPATSPGYHAHVSDIPPPGDETGFRNPLEPDPTGNITESFNKTSMEAWLRATHG